MVDLPLWIWIVVWGIAAWVAYAAYRMLDAAFTAARLPEEMMKARVMRTPVALYHIAKSDLPSHYKQIPGIGGPESVFGPALRTHGPATDDISGGEQNWIGNLRRDDEPEVMADAIEPSNLEFTHPQLYGMESVTRAMLRQTQKRLPLDPKPLLPKNPTEDDLVARDPEIREMVREIRAVGEEIDAVRDARERRRARRGWFGWLRKNEPAEIAYGMSNTREM